MDDRIVDFIAALRAMGVRVSLAESQDAMRAIEHMGVMDRESFRISLKTTLVKEAADGPIFDRLFPLFFSAETPQMLNGLGGLSPEEQQMLREALRQLARDLARRLQQLMEGRGLSREELERMGQQAGLPNAHSPYQQSWITRRMLQQMGFNSLEEALEQMLQMLAALGMSQAALDQLSEAVGENREAVEEQINRFVGAGIAKNMAEDYQRRPPINDLMNRPLQSLSEEEADELRNQVRRLAARLRSRAALRQKHGKKGQLDAKATIRASLKYGSVPLEIKHKRRHLKPKLCLIADVSTSMRPVADFMLRLMYELSDQLAKARSFAFIDDINEISQSFAENPPEVAVPEVLDHLRPGYYNTDLGFSLAHFTQDYFDAVDRRTTVIILGDGRNNFNDPRLDSLDAVKRRARKLLWFNPEYQPLWGTGDSDMLAYAPLCDAVHTVSTLAQLADAVDHLFDTH
ncbi:MAG TPA: VWA domain-containing protein [Anaerolineae bacterium]|nr:VWA domain-containing protein [Anaerolineae bacterium]